MERYSIFFRCSGYTRIIKCGFRAGDSAPMAFLELVDRPLLENDDESDEGVGDGTIVVVDDSGHDLDSADFQWENAYYYGELWNNTGGRLWVQSYANCFPAKF